MGVFQPERRIESKSRYSVESVLQLLAQQAVTTNFIYITAFSITKPRMTSATPEPKRLQQQKTISDAFAGVTNEAQNTTEKPRITFHLAEDVVSLPGANNSSVSVI